MAPPTASADNSSTTQDIANPGPPLASVTADNDDGEVDHGEIILTAHVELSRSQRASLHIYRLWTMTHFYSHDLIELKRARTVCALAIELAIPDLTILFRRFLFECLNPNDTCDITTVPHFELPYFDGPISVVNSASSQFYAPSDLSGSGGMHKEYI